MQWFFNLKYSEIWKFGKFIVITLVMIRTLFQFSSFSYLTSTSTFKNIGQGRYTERVANSNWY